MFVQRTASNCKYLSVQTKHLALPVGRDQDSYKFPTSEAVIPEVATAVYWGEVQTVVLGNDPGVLQGSSLLLPLQS